MKTFKDRHGNEWEIDASLGAFERVRDLAGVDLTDMASTGKCLEQMADPFVLGGVLWVLCQRQAEKRGMTPEQFRDCFNGDTVHEATEALIDEVVFFCRAPMRPALQMAVDKARAADQKMVGAINANLGRIGEAIDRALFSTFTDSVTSSAESSVSIHDRGPSDASSGQPPASSARRGSTRPASSRKAGR